MFENKPLDITFDMKLYGVGTAPGYKGICTEMVLNACINNM